MDRAPRLALLAVAAASLLGSCGPTTPQFAFNFTEQRGRLDANGLRFVVMPDPSTELVEVDVRYEVGSREDPPGKAGLAHLVEHLMFQLKLRPDLPPVMHLVGQMSTFFNAYTNWDSTHYMTTVRAENFESVLTIESKRLELGCQSISEDEFLREREVVRNEIRQRGGDASGQIPQLVMDEVYPTGHAYREMIGGDDAQLSTITLADACAWIGKYYVPERATVIIAGGVDVKTATDGLAKWFNGLPRKAGAPRRVVEEVKPATGRKTIDLDIERPMVAVAWPMPASNTKAGEAVQWGIGRSFGKIAQKAEEYGFAYDVQPAVLGGVEAPIYVVLIELKGLGKLDEALDFVWKAAKDAYRGYEDIPWQYLEELKNQQKASFIEGIEQLSSRTNQVGEMVQFDHEIDFDDGRPFMFHQLDKIDQFDGEYIGEQIKRYINPDRAKVVVFRPNEAGVKGDVRSKVKFQTKSHDSIEPLEVDPAEAKRPITVAAELKALDGTVRFELGNGMKVQLLQTHSMPLIFGRLDFGFGDALTADSPALAGAAAAFLNPPLDAEALSRTGVSPGCFSGPDTTTCIASGVSIYLDVIIKGLERLVKAGEYDQDQLERWQRRTKEAYATRAAQTQLEFQRQLLTSVFGPEHPYAITGVTTPADAARLGVDDLKSFARKHFSAANATLTIVGDFDPARAESLVRDAFGGWGRGHHDAQIAPTPAPRSGPVYVGVVDDKPGPQMGVAIAFPAPAGIDGQEAARQVLAEMLNIRMGDIRFKLGATYGTYATKATRVGPAMYQMGGTVDAARAGEALAAMRAGIDKLRNDPTTFAIDFVRARRKILTELLGESTVTSELAARLARMARFGLAPDYYNRLLQLVAATGPAQIKALLAAEIDPSTEVVVTTAGRDTLTAAFTEAGITDVKLVEPEYK
ncbi:MAG: insulinase family protein [Kofleriaceae bacterium]